VTALAAKPVSASKTVFAKSMLPSDANPSGNVHGHARQRVVTARVDELSFVAPVYVGNLVTARASVNDVGTKSMEVGVRVDAEDMLTGKVVHVSSAYLVFVAIDKDGKTIPIPPLIAETDEEKRRMAAAKLRRERRLGQG